MALNFSSMYYWISCIAEKEHRKKEGELMVRNLRERDQRVIRPFMHVREKTLGQFAESRNLQIIPENCPVCFDAPKERHRVKQLLAQQEILFPHLFWSLRSALHPLISFRHTGEESRIYTRHRKQSQSHGMHPTSDALSSDTEEEPVS